MEKLPLTSRQKEILEFLGSHTRDFGYPPTVREICRATGLKSPRSVSQHLQALERKGYIQRGRDKSRAIRFLHRPDSLGPATSEGGHTLSLRGRVAAGNGPAAVADAPGGDIVVDRALFADPGNFLMKVEGGCMADTHILDGDLVVVCPDPSVKDGDVVVARVGGEVTVKRFQTRDGAHYLVSQVSELRIGSHAPEVTILGKVVGLIRPCC